ncbi:MAG TPA: TetR/AcrR family transcriptional regulator [Candidatus Limnocylindrales bacterium]|nr:TetR/AcrR family transcriptional regulator [Candidatus Limnocylindrales bacterium]
MPRTSAEHATEMRQRILDGAHRAMLSGGYHGTTMPAIAAEAEVSVGLLYRYFESKEELYLAMCEGVTQANLDELAVQMSRISDPRERLAAAIRTYIESLETERWGAIVTAGWAEADVKPALRDLLRRRCDQVRAFAAMFLREAIAAGEVEPTVDVEEFTVAATMLMDGVIAHQAEAGDRFDAGLVERAVIGLLGSILRR